MVEIVTENWTLIDSQDEGVTPATIVIQTQYGTFEGSETSWGSGVFEGKIGDNKVTMEAGEGEGEFSLTAGFLGLAWDLEATAYKLAS